MTKRCIALDAMGGDHGPSVVVPAAIDIVSTYPDLQLVLVGDPDQLQNELKQHQHQNNPNLTIKPTTQVVAMDDPPALALRKKRDSSMRVAIDLVKEGKADACVSAGNTGALMATARFVLKTLPGVDRPAIVYSLPNMKDHVHVLDLGANVDCEPEHLFQFAVMGSVLASAIDANPSPTVGLLNIGSEAIKGSHQVKQAAELLNTREVPINYIGFVEGDDIYQGTVDVVVCDGFVGNVALKVSEGLAKMVLHEFKAQFGSSLYSKLAGLLSYPILKRLIKRLDPSRYNGASFLGLRGIVIKSHGGAKRDAFANAIRVAWLEIEKNVPATIQTELAAHLGVTGEA